MTTTWLQDSRQLVTKPELNPTNVQDFQDCSKSPGHPGMSQLSQSRDIPGPRGHVRPRTGGGMVEQDVPPWDIAGCVDIPGPRGHVRLGTCGVMVGLDVPTHKFSLGIP